jgi:hypothetical protein
MIFSPCSTNSNEPNIGFWGGIFHLDIYGARQSFNLFAREMEKFELGKFINIHPLPLFF